MKTVPWTVFRPWENPGAFDGTPVGGVGKGDIPRHPAFSQLLTPLPKKIPDLILFSSQVSSFCVGIIPGMGYSSNFFVIWTISRADLTEYALKYPPLDQYGRDAVEAIIRAEYNRCRCENTLCPATAYTGHISIKR